MTLRYGQQLRLVALWALLLPFVLLSLITSNVMPAKAATGEAVFILCTGEGMIEIAFDPVTMEPITDSDRHNDPDSGCDWAAAQHPVDLQPTTIPALPCSTALKCRLTVSQTTLIQAAATGLPPSTGPPSAI